MTAFATAQDLATFLEHDVDTARAQMLLEQSSAAIRKYTAQDFDLVTGDVTRIRVVADKVVLPQIPVVAVNSVSRVNPVGVTLIPGWIFDGIDTIYGSNRLTWVINLPAVWTDYPYPTTVEVNYDHGYATVPADVKSVAIGMAARFYETPAAGAITQERIGDYSYKVAEVRGEGRLLALQADEKEILDDYKRSAARSIALR